MSLVRYGRTGIDALDTRLAGHPRLVAEGASTPGRLDFVVGDWHRSLVLDSNDGTLTETEDNNPLVCAHLAAVPTPGLTLALIALSPLVQAELVAAEPALLFSFVPDALPEQILGLEYSPAVQPVELGSVVSLNALVEIPKTTQPEEVASLFEEVYGRSYYVQAGEADWDTAQVAGRPEARYRLRLTPGEESHLLNVQVMADRDGKCGSAQILHKLNVMCGFEETLGIN